MPFKIITLRHILSVAAGLIVSLSAFAQNQPNHAFEITIRPTQSYIKVTDLITLGENLEQKNEFRFLLHKDLIIESPAGLKPQLIISEQLQSIAEKISVPLHQYNIPLTSNQKQLTISYRGRISHSLTKPEEESARSFSKTAGLIDKEGIFLAKSTAWYPLSEQELVTFSAQIELPSS